MKKKLLISSIIIVSLIIIVAVIVRVIIKKENKSITILEKTDEISIVPTMNDKITADSS